MTTRLFAEISRARILVAGVFTLTLVTFVAGCRTPINTAALQKAAQREGTFTLREGDVVKISFPGAPKLDTTQPIRRDGKIALEMVGEVKAVDLTPGELEKVLLQLYSAQLVTKSVMVTVVSSTYPVFVTGAVLRPGKILSDHPISALEAIMEAGGFDYAKANLRRVVVLRQEGDQTKHYTIDLKLVLDGKSSQPFYLKPSDIVYVPERFTWF
jgi:polysaccharide export outer membrane protein